MPRTITVTLQDGSTHTYQNAPDSVTPEQVSARAQADFGQPVTALDGGRNAAANPPTAPSLMQRLSASAPGRFLHGVLDPIAGTVQLAANLGGVNPVIDTAVDPRTGEGYADPVQERSAKALNGAIANSEQNYQAARKATGQSGIDVARIAGNIASPINFAIPGPAQGASLMGRVANGAMTGGLLSGLQPVTSSGDYRGEKLAQIGLGALGGGAMPLVGAGIKAGGRFLRGLVGETTGAGGKALAGAYEAGKAGGEQAKAFADSMRGNVSWPEVVDDAKFALGNLRAQRAQAYRSGMLDVGADKSILAFAPIDEAMQATASVKNFKGVDLSPKTADVRQEVQGAIDAWKALDPAEYHTPEGFDALKQQIGGIKDSYQYGTPQWKIANEAYNAVRGAITKQAPAYDKVMRGYSEAADEIASLERELSLGKKANPNTALRKLQSVMRDNANTSWGMRSAMADRLSEAGAPNLLPSLAGQALSTPIPRGLAKYGDAAAYGVAALHNPMTLLALPAASPRAMGELAYGAGTVARGAAALGDLPIIQGIPRLAPGAFGVGLPQLFANPAINGAQ